MKEMVNNKYLFNVYKIGEEIKEEEKPIEEPIKPQQQEESKKELNIWLIIAGIEFIIIILLLLLLLKKNKKSDNTEIKSNIELVNTPTNDIVVNSIPPVEETDVIEDIEIIPKKNDDSNFE